MTIDEKFLSNLIVGDVGEGERSWAIGHITEDEAVELIRLARLGLEAQRVIQDAENYFALVNTPNSDYSMGRFDTYKEVHKNLSEVLAQLPKELSKTEGEK